METRDDESPKSPVVVMLDPDLLARLTDAIRGAAQFASSGEHLIAIGEVWAALELLVAGEEVQVNTELSLGIEVVDGRSRGGTFYSIRANDEGLIMDRMTTTYDPDVGSDHAVEVMATIIPGRGNVNFETNEWLDRFDAMARISGARLTVSRDHV